MPLLTIFLKRPAWAKVLCYIFLYPLIIMYASKQSHFHLNPSLVFAAALISMGIAALMLMNPTIKERVSDPSDSRITGPAYFAGITGIFLLLIFLSGVIPSSPFKDNSQYTVEKMETMDLSDNSDSSMMTMIPNAIMVEPEKIIPEKNINNIEMDSTPLSELMNDTEVFDSAPMSKDPRVNLQSQSQSSSASTQVVTPKPKKQKAVQYPFNLTEEQMDALLAGAAAILAFSSTAQDKLASIVPSAFEEGGARTTMGIIVTGIIAAIAYYIMKKFAMPKPQYN